MTDTSAVPLHCIDQPSVAGTLIKLAALIPALALALVPLTLLASAGAETVSVAAEQPIATLSLSIGLMLCMLLAVVPTARLIRRLGYSRVTTISDGVVIVAEQSWFGARTTKTPLRQFDGIAHLVRTSLSGTWHELQLIERQTGQRVACHRADRLTRETIDSIARQLGLPIIEATDVVQLSWRPMLRLQPATA